MKRFDFSGISSEEIIGLWGIMLRYVVVLLFKIFPVDLHVGHMNLSNFVQLCRLILFYFASLWF